MVRFQHSHPFLAGSFANVESKDHLKKLVFTGALDLAFALRTRRLQRMSNPLQWRTSTLKANDPFHAKKGSGAVHLFHLGGAQRLVTWLKSRENKALMSP